MVTKIFRETFRNKQAAKRQLIFFSLVIEITATIKGCAKKTKTSSMADSYPNVVFFH